MLQRIRRPPAVPPYDALRWATKVRACLGRNESARSRPAAGRSRAVHARRTAIFRGQDPLAALALCGAHRADRVMVAGTWRVIDGSPEGVDLPALIASDKAAARAFA